MLPEFWEAGTGTAAAAFDYTQVASWAASQPRHAKCNHIGWPSRHIGRNPTQKTGQGESGLKNEAKWEYFRLIYERMG